MDQRSEIKVVIVADTGDTQRKVEGLDRSISNLGQSAKATAAQARNLSYQMTDITVGLATGQSPLMVLLQQGGQLKDAYGGVLGALRAVAGGFAAMVTPASVAAVAVGSVGAAWYAGVQQSAAFQAALRTTGNAAGITEGQFDSLAKRVAEASGATISEARELSLALVASGQIGREGFDKVALGATLLQRATGKTAQDVAQDMVAMTRNVADWASKHNEQWHFATSAQIDHIRSLEQAGEKQRALSETLDLMTPHLKNQAENIGYIERGWRAVAREFDNYKNSVVSGLGNWGKPGTAESRLAAARQDLSWMQQGTFQNAGFGDQLAAMLSGNWKSKDTLLAEQQRKVRDLEIEERDGRVRAANRAQAIADDKLLGEQREQLRAITDRLNGSNSEYSKSLKTIQALAAANVITEEQRIDLLTRLAFEQGPKGDAKGPRDSKAKLDWHNVGDFVGPMFPSPTGPNIADELLKARERAPAELARLAEDLRQQTSALNISLISDDRKRGEAQIELDQSTLQARIDALAEGGRDISQAQAALNENILAQQAQLNEQLKPEWQRMVEAWRDVNSQMSSISREFQQGFVDSGRGAFQEFLRTGKVSMQSFENLVIESITKLVYDRYIANSFATLGANLFAYLSGGGASPASFLTPSTSTAGGGVDGFIPNPVAGYASGGFHRGGWRVVGERGRELEYTGPSRIFSNADTERMLSGGGPAAVIYQTINAGAGVNRAEFAAGLRIAKDAAVAEIEARVVRGNRLWSGG